MTKRAALRRHPAIWGAMAVVAVGVLVFAGTRVPDEGTSDDRLYGLAEQLKCLQCVGESVAASQSPLAQQFRDEIGEQMAAGETDDEILAFFADRYGNEVLLDPPASGLGALAWLLPVVVAAGAIMGLGLAFTRWRGNSATGEGPRIDEVVMVGSTPAGSSSGEEQKAPAGSGLPAGGDEETPGSGKWRGIALVGGIGAFVVLVGVLLAGGTGQRGDGELTGGNPNVAVGSEASGSQDSGLEGCQPLAMSDPAAGIDCYDELLEDDPDNAEALTYRGWAKIRAGQSEDGTADLESAVVLAPDYADPHVFLAIALVEAGDFAGASREMADFWAADPSSVAVSVVQSEGLERQVFFGLMTQGTRLCWQEAAEEAPAGEIDQEFLDVLAGCLEMALQVDPTDPDARLSLALAKLGPQTSDPEAARSLLTGLLAENPDNSDALALLVSLDLSQGDIETAESGLEDLEDLPRGPAAFLIGDAGVLRAALDAAQSAG